VYGGTVPTPRIDSIAKERIGKSKPF